MADSTASMLGGAEENALVAAFSNVSVSDGHHHHHPGHHQVAHHQHQHQHHHQAQHHALHGQQQGGHMHVHEPTDAELDEYDDERCLFIGDLARGLTEEQLKEAFEPYGVAAVEIKRDRVTGYSLGYGFASFKTTQDAANAKKALHKAVVGGRQVRLGWAQKNTNLFIGDLDPSVTSEQLREVFRRFGPLYEEETFVKNRNYGFVRFRHRKHAENAKREMNGKVIGSRAIRIGWGDANYQRHCVHIQFEPSESENLTESEVIAKFEEHGTVMSVNLPRNQGSLRGFGFIYYDDTDAGEVAAAKAITSLNNSLIGGVRIQCNFGKKPSNKKKQLPTTGRVKGGMLKGGRVGGGMAGLGLGLGMGMAGLAGQGLGGSGRGLRGSQQALFPVQVMMPVGPQGAWQPVQYMMTAQQAHQFYNSIQYNHTPAAPSSPSPSREVPSPQHHHQQQHQPHHHHQQQHPHHHQQHQAQHHQHHHQQAQQVAYHGYAVGHQQQ